MNPYRAKDLTDMIKLDRWDALIRDNELEMDGISDKMRQATLFSMAPVAVVENRLAGRRDFDNYAKVRCMIDDMIRDKTEGVFLVFRPNPCCNVHHFCPPTVSRV